VFRAGKMRIAASLIIIAALLGGCGPAPRKFVRPNVQKEKFQRLAVLPIDNFTAEKFAGEKMRQAIITELLASGVDVVEPGEVNNVLVKLQIQSLRTLTREQLKSIGKELNVNTLMTGFVGEYGMKKGVRVSYPEISVNLMMHDAASGEVFWSVWHTTGGPSFWTRYFGAEGNTLNEAAREMVKKAIGSYF